MANKEEPKEADNGDREPPEPPDSSDKDTTTTTGDTVKDLAENDGKLSQRDSLKNSSRDLAFAAPSTMASTTTTAASKATGTTNSPIVASATTGAPSNAHPSPNPSILPGGI